jgi:general stress protein 26
MQNSTDQDNNAQKVWDLIKDAHSALLVTVEADGLLESRPMGCVHTDFEGTIWFLTFAHSSKVNEISKDNRVLVSYASAAKYEYVSLSGTARLVRDPEKLKELWSEAFRVWFPSGLDDPELALLGQSGRSEILDRCCFYGDLRVGLFESAFPQYQSRSRPDLTYGNRKILNWPRLHRLRKLSDQRK